MVVGDMVAAYPANGDKPEIGQIVRFGACDVDVLIAGHVWGYCESQLRPVKPIFQWIDAETGELLDVAG